MISLSFINLLIYSRISETQSMELGIGTVSKPQPVTVEGDLHIGDVKLINDASEPAHVQNSEELDGLKVIEWLKIIKEAVDTMELTVADVEEIRVNMADVERMIGVDPTDTTGSLTAISTFKGTNELLTDLKTLLTTGSSGQEMQVDIVGELPVGTKNIGHVDIDTLIPPANLDQKASAASLSVTPATDIDDETYIGDIKFGEELPVGTKNIGKVDIEAELPEGTKNIGHVDIDALPAAQIGETDQANSMSVTLATDDELLKTVDQSNTAVRVVSPTATNLKAEVSGGTTGLSVINQANTTLGVASELTIEDYDTDGGASIENVAVVGLVTPASGGPVVVDGANKLPVDTGLTDFNGVVTNTVLTSLDAAINTNRVDVNIAAGGFDGALTAAPGVEIGKLAVGTANIGNVKLGALAAGANAIGKLSANSGTDIGDVDILSLPSGNIGQRAQTASLSVTLASDDDLQTCINTTNDRLKVQVDSGAFDGTLTGLGEKAQTGSLSVTLATDDDLLNCVDKSNNQLNVSIENGGFDGAVTGAFYPSTQDVAISSGGFSGVVTTATNTQLAVTTVQSALTTSQHTTDIAINTAKVVSSSLACQSGLTVVADSANTDTVYVGPSGVSTSSGFPLAAGAGFTFSVNNAQLIYSVSATASQKLNLVAM